MGLNFGKRGLWAWSLAPIAVVAALIPVGAAPAKMQSVQLGPKVCETTGGGRFVKIPAFPGERIDRRLLNDVKFLVRKYDIFITDGYSLDPAHAANGEHPVGLAMDIVPNFGAGGDWNDIDRLANWAEPYQNQPRSPFNWVGYNGDAGHGRGHHLHLSFRHTATPYNNPARTVYSVKCPDSAGSNDGGGGGGEEPDGGGRKDDKPGGGRGDDGSSGGVGAGSPGGNGGDGNGGGKKDDKPGQGGGSGGGNGGGGIPARGGAELAPIHPETGGVSR